MAAPTDRQRQYLDVLEAIDNPTLHTAETMQCVSCHIATTVRADRARAANLDVAGLPSHFTAPAFEQTPQGDSGMRFRTLRALGWFGTSTRQRPGRERDRRRGAGERGAVSTRPVARHQAISRNNSSGFSMYLMNS
jgi:hypothetical protein